MTQEVELRIHLKVGDKAKEIQVVELRDKEKVDGVDSTERMLRIYRTEDVVSIVEIGDYVATDKAGYYCYTKEEWHRLLGKEEATKWNKQRDM